MSFKITILGTANAQARAQGANAVPAPAKPTVARVKGSTPTLQVTWSAISTSSLTFTVSGYELEYRQQGSSSWTQKSYGSTTTSADLSTLAPATNYEVQVRAVVEHETGDGCCETIRSSWSEIGSGWTNRPPVLGGTPSQTNVSRAVGTLTKVPGNWAGLFEDPDGDALTRVVGSDKPDRVSAELIDEHAKLFAYRALNQGQATITFGVTDTYNSSLMLSFTVTVTHDVTLQIVESSLPGTSVGAPVTGTPYQGETLTYSLSGEATGAFVINSSTGQISVKQGATLDYETKNTYTGQVKLHRGKASSPPLTGSPLR